MLRTIASFPLSHLATPVTTRALPALSTLAPRLCEFSTKVSRKEKAIPIDNKNKTHDEASLHDKPSNLFATSPVEPFTLSRGFDEWFARDPFLSRHPFWARDSLFQSMFKDEDPFETIRKEIMPVLQTRPSLHNTGGTLLRASPGYEIKESDGTYEIALDIPKGLETKDLKVEVEADGTVVHVSGEHSVKQDNVESVTRFSKRFLIGNLVDTEQLQANYADGCLVIRAPKIVTNPGKRQIEITNLPHEQISDEELRQMNYSDEFDESDWAESCKKAA